MRAVPLRSLALLSLPRPLGLLPPSGAAGLMLRASASAPLVAAARSAARQPRATSRRQSGKGPHASQCAPPAPHTPLLTPVTPAAVLDGTAQRRQRSPHRLDRAHWEAPAATIGDAPAAPDAPWGAPPRCRGQSVGSRHRTHAVDDDGPLPSRLVKPKGHRSNISEPCRVTAKPPTARSAAAMGSSSSPSLSLLLGRRATDAVRTRTALAGAPAPMTGALNGPTL